MPILDSSIRQYMSNPLMPLYPGSKQLPVNFAANTYFARGRVLGQITSSANDVQTIAFGGGPTGGSAKIKVYHPLSMASAALDIAYNASAATVQALLVSVLGANVTVTGGPLPGAPLVVTFSGQFVEMPVALMSLVSSALTGGAPTVTITHTTIGRSIATFAPYVGANSDGSQVAKCLNMYELVTDSGGNVTFGRQTFEGNNGVIEPYAPAHYSGAFATEEIVGLDMGAVAQLGTLDGTLAKGILFLRGF
jgi:hypothetical protein